MIKVDIPVYNRKFITEKCLEKLRQIKIGSQGVCQFDIYLHNDKSSEFSQQFLNHYGDYVINYKNHQGIHKIRSQNFKDFLDSSYDFLYLTDNDALHDNLVFQKLRQGYESTQLPVTAFISNYCYNNFSWYKINPVNSDIGIIKGSGGGISWFLSREHVKKIVNKMGEEFQDMWDCYMLNALGNVYAITLNSYVEHLGKDGMHHQSWDSECCLHPTKEIQEESKKIIKEYEQK